LVTNLSKNYDKIKGNRPLLANFVKIGPTLTATWLKSNHLPMICLIRSFWCSFDSLECFFYKI